MQLWQLWPLWKVSWYTDRTFSNIVLTPPRAVDNPLFNCAKGAVFNVDGKVSLYKCLFCSNFTEKLQNELEASIMLSKPPASHPDIPATRRGLGLTLLTRSRNPSRVARALYLSPSLAPHTFLSGSAADTLGETLGQDMVNPSYYFTERRWREHRRGLGLPEEPLPYHTHPSPEQVPLDQLPKGTVGAVALDMRGCIAAVTSTGGRTNKSVGRIGDTPSMGSGFWAEEWKRDKWRHKIWAKLTGRHKARAVGVSGTGDGDVCSRFSSDAISAKKYFSISLGRQLLLP